ncbi:MAG: PQQ-binding-like beta-propeller repeat protein [Planctomycetota bacterium]
MNGLRTTAALLIFNALSVHADWPQFRGSNSSGISIEEIPTVFGPGKNELWNVAVGSGHSSPCVVGENIFLTAHEAESRSLDVICLSRIDGTVRWRQSVTAAEIEKGHPSFHPASSSPACDGERVVAYFGSYGLVCFDVNGTQLWEMKLPLAKSYGGNAASPIIVNDRVVLYRATYEDHFLLALDKFSGKELWRVPQAEPFTGEMACTACPIVAGDLLIAHTARSVQAFELETGERRWVTKCATTATSTPVLHQDQVVVAAWNKMGEPALRPEFPNYEKLIREHDVDGDQAINQKEFPRLWIFHRPDGIEAPQNGAPLNFRRSDGNGDGKLDAEEWSKTLEGIARFREGYQSHGILAIPLKSSGVIAPATVRKLATNGIPEVPSPVSHNGLLYFVKNGGVLTCLDLETGERVYRRRTKGKGTHYASPVIAGKTLLTTAGNGRISVIAVGRTPETLAVNEMGENVYATPAVDAGVLYVRTHSRLFAFGRRTE